MSEILTSDLTNKEEGEIGTGVFDILMNTTTLQLAEQFDEGRITGAEFAEVYLGAMQAVMAQSVTFLLGKQAADKQADLITAQTNEVNENIDAVIAKTAQYYEAIKASQADTLRKNLLNNATIDKTNEEIDLLQSQDLEVIADTIRKDAQHEAGIVDLNHAIAIKAQQEYGLSEKNGLVVITYTYYINGVDGATDTTTDLDNVVGPVISTTIAAGAGESVVALDKLILHSKDALLDAQTLGFASDTKQKVLKQMFENYAVNLSIAGKADVPEAGQDTAIDALVDSILNGVDGAGTWDISAAAETIPPDL